eukprot:scaffold85135_cov17-Prasinocladus_malaysianus.AAC.1
MIVNEMSPVRAVQSCPHIAWLRPASSFPGPQRVLPSAATTLRMRGIAQHEGRLGGRAIRQARAGDNCAQSNPAKRLRQQLSQL